MTSRPHSWCCRQCCRRKSAASSCNWLPAISPHQNDSSARLSSRRLPMRGKPRLWALGMLLSSTCQRARYWRKLIYESNESFCTINEYDSYMAESPLEIRHLRMLNALAETGSVSQAAQRVHLTQ